MPLPQYSESLQNNKQFVEFPFSKKIVHYLISLPLILLIIYGLNLPLATYSVFSYCDASKRLEPCEFNGKMKFYEINLLRNEINGVQKKVDEITNVMQYGLSTESSKTLLQKQNSINETLHTLKQKYDNQKTEWEKCYYNNFKTNSSNYTLFVKISAIIFAIIILLSFAKAYSYLRIVPVSELNEEQTVAFQELYWYSFCWIGFLFLFLGTCISLIFIYGFDRNETIQDIPIFVAETWMNTCGKTSVKITANEFLASKS